MPFDTAQTQTARPVSHEDAAWFATIPQHLNGEPNPDYGKVFRREDYRGWTMYSFDREGLRFCRGLWNGPSEGWLEVQGRGFLIVSEVSQ